MIPIATSLIAFSLLVQFSFDVGQPKGVAEVQLVRLLGVDEFRRVRRQFEKLGGYSAAALPLYARVLDDPRADAMTVARTLGALARVKGTGAISGVGPWTA